MKISFLTIILFIVLGGNTLSSQTDEQLYGCLPSSQGSNNLTDGELLKNFTQDKDWTNPKTVRLVFHYFQTSSGTDNFSESSQGIWGLDGYELAEQIVNTINGRSNIQMNIPSGNSIPVRQKNISFVVDHVFFYQNDTHHPYSSNANTTFNTFAFDPDHTIQVFMKEETGVASSSGNASNVSLTNTNEKWVEINTDFSRYISATTTQQAGTWFSVLFHNIGHELFHTLGLSHTVRNNNGSLCDETDPSDCDDFCDDTPTPYEMYTLYSATFHPACGWGNGNSSGCSNNWMDYSGMGALTPDQIDRMHLGLENNLSVFRVCEELQNTNTFCSLGYPLVRAFGESITIGGCGGSPPVVEEDNINTIFFSDEVIFESIEVESGAEFEVIYQDSGC